MCFALRPSPLRVLTEVEELTNLLCVGAVYESCVVKISLALFALLSQDVTVIGVFSLNLPCAGEREALL